MGIYRDLVTSCFHLLSKAFTATEPGMGGCAGMMLQQELNRCSIALITFRTLILQVYAGI